MNGKFYSILILLMLNCFLVLAAQAQTTAFTYQGRFTDSTVAQPTNGTYDFQFALFDLASGGTQQGVLQTVSGVTVTNGTFTVQLDFGTSAFPGADRFLEISVKKPADASYTPLAPRQQLTSSPYAIQTINAAQLGGVPASQYVQTTDSRLSDARAPAAGSGNYIQNTTSQQSNSNFNISGDGTVGGTLKGNTVSATTQYDIGTDRVLGFAFHNVLVGSGAGAANGPGDNNVAVGENAASKNTNGFFNVFVGSAAGANNTIGTKNVFIGHNSGASNKTENSNTFIGESSNGAAGITNATAIGAGAQVTVSNGLVLGSNVNVGIGTSAPTSRLHVIGNGTFSGALSADNVNASSAGNLVFNGQSSSDTGTWLRLQNSATGGHNWNIISTGSGNSEGAGKLLFNDQTSGGTRMQLDGAGAAFAGNGSFNNNLTVGGNLTVSGALNATVTTSNFATLPHCKAQQTTAQTFASGSTAIVQLDATQFCSAVTFDNANNRLVIVTSGLYQVNAEILFIANSNGLRYLEINSSNGGEVAAASMNAVNGFTTQMNAAGIVRLNAGDTVSLSAAQTSGGNLNTEIYNGRSASLSVVWVAP